MRDWRDRDEGVMACFKVLAHHRTAANPGSVVWELVRSSDQTCGTLRGWGAFTRQCGQQMRLLLVRVVCEKRF